MRITQGLIASFVLSSVSANAADTDSRTLEEVIVTATYRDTELMQTPLAISAVDSQLIEELGATDMQSLFRNIPGLNVTSTGSGADRIVVRGISSQTGTAPFAQTSSTVAVYIDDTPMTSANGPAREINGSLFDIDRVEVLKGPQGTLFGEGSQGGTIRYLYTRPDLTKVDYRVKGTYGFQDESDEGSTYRVDGMVNLPLGEEFAVRVAAFKQERAGWIDKTNLVPIRRDVNTLESEGGRFSALWTPTEALSVQGTIFYADVLTGGGVYVQRPFEEDQSIPVHGFPDQSQDEMTVYALKAEYNFGFATLTSASSYVDRRAHSFFSNPILTVNANDRFSSFSVNVPYFLAGQPTPLPCINGGPNPNFANTTICPWGDAQSMLAYGGESISETSRRIQEFRLVSNGDGPLLWTAGLFWKSSDDRRHDWQQYSLRPGREFVEPYIRPIYSDSSNSHTDTIDEIAGFGELTYEFTDTLAGTLGTRYSKVEQDFESTPFTTDDTFLAPKAVLSWQRDPDQLYYLSYAVGFRPGNVNNNMDFNIRTFGPAAGQALLDRFRSLLTFSGDEVANYELGSKLTLFGGQVQTTLSLYHLEWKDMILGLRDTTLPTTNNTYNSNVGAAHSSGIELEMTALVTDRLRVRLSGDFNEAELDDDNPAIIGGGRGQRLLFSPKWAGAIGVDYTASLPASLEANFRLDHQRVASQFTSLANTVEIPGYHHTNLRVSLRSETDSRWSAAVSVNNLSNEVYLVNSFITGGASYFLFAQPRSITLEFNWAAQ